MPLVTFSIFLFNSIIIKSYQNVFTLEEYELNQIKNKNFDSLRNDDNFNLDLESCVKGKRLMSNNEYYYPVEGGYYTSSLQECIELRQLVRRQYCACGHPERGVAEGAYHGPGACYN